MAVLQEKTIRLSVIIVHYMTDDLTLALLQSLPRRKDAEVIVVDNGPTDEFRKKLKGDHDHVIYVRTGRNAGFAGGNNKGIAMAKGDWILLLNSDTVTTWKDLDTLIEVTEKHHCAVAAPRLQLHTQIERNVGYFDPPYRNPVNWILARPRMIDTTDISDAFPVDVATGGALLIHRSVFDEVGYLDDRTYFMYFEDIDFSLRLHDAGIRILYVPQSRITHYGGASSPDGGKKRGNYLNGLRAYLDKHRGKVIRMLNDRLKLFH